MSLKVRILEGFDAVAAVAEQWNDLWRRSEVTIPTARAELIGLWLERFAHDKRFCAIVVEEDSRFLAALPLVTTRLGKIVPAAGLPHNQWCCGGDLMLDPTADVEGCLVRIAETLGQLPWPLYRFSHVRIETRTWRHFVDAITRAGLAVECRPGHEVKLIPTPKNWETYRAQFSKSHRQRFARMFKRLGEVGHVQFRRITPADFDEAKTLLHTAFKIEDSGWKGRAGTSLARAQGMTEYVEQMAYSLVANRELELAFLDVNGEAAAFQILWNTKGVLYAYKGSYDEKYQRFGLGHLMIHEVLRELTETQRCRAYDCLGPNTPAIDQWIGTTYPTSQVTIAPKHWLGRAMLFTYRHCRPARNRSRTINAEPESAVTT